MEVEEKKIEEAKQYIEKFISGEGKFSLEKTNTCKGEIEIGTIEITIEDEKRYLTARDLEYKYIHPLSENEINGIRKKIINGELNICVDREPDAVWFGGYIFGIKDGELKYISYDSGF